VVLKLMSCSGDALTGPVVAYSRRDVIIAETHFCTRLGRTQIQDILHLDPHPIQNAWLHQMRRHFGVVHEVAIRFFYAAVERFAQVYNGEGLTPATRVSTGERVTIRRGVPQK
jgi:hypothetical protein